MVQTVQQNQRELPKGWHLVRLADVISEAQPGFASGARDPHGVVQLRMNNVDKLGNLIWDEFIRVPSDAESLSRYRLEPNDILFNNTNSVELVGKSGVFKGFSEPVVYSNHFTRIRVKKEKGDAGYIAAWLHQQWRSKVFEYICNRWIGQSAVKNDKLLALEIPLPPLPEQNRIAAILNEQLAAVEKARKAAKTQLEAAESLSAAYLRTVFNSPEAQEWPIKRLDAICDIQLGKMLSPKSKTNTRPRPYLRNVNVQWNHFDLSEVVEMDFTETEEEKFKLRRGDLLVCEGGEPGRSAIWQGQIDPCYYQKALHRLRPINGRADPFFLMYRLWLGAVNDEFLSSHAKTTIAHLPAIRLSSLLVGVPSLPEQQLIAQNLTEKLSGTQNVLGTLTAQLDTINKLPAALLRQAFNGEL